MGGGVERYKRPIVSWGYDGEILGLMCKVRGRFQGSCIGGWRMGDLWDHVYDVISHDQWVSGLEGGRGYVCTHEQ